MQRTRRARIQDLTARSSELTDEGLRMVSGGAPTCHIKMDSHLVWTPRIQSCTADNESCDMD
jgi:hypothetical protein